MSKAMMIIPVVVSIGLTLGGIQYVKHVQALNEQRVERLKSDLEDSIAELESMRDNWEKSESERQKVKDKETQDLIDSFYLGQTRHLIPPSGSDIHTQVTYRLANEAVYMNDKYYTKECDNVRSHVRNGHHVSSYERNCRLVPLTKSSYPDVYKLLMDYKEKTGKN